MKKLKDIRSKYKSEAVDTTDTGGAEEVSMATGQIKAMRHYLDGIEKRVKAEGDMEEWFQNKLTKANDYLKTLYGYGKGKTNESVEVEEAVQFKVDIEGLPPTFMQGRSSAEILAKLRKIVKQPSMIKDVERHTDMEVKKAYRQKAQGRDVDEASVVPSADGKSLVPMKKRPEPKDKPVPNSQFGLPRLKKTNEEAKYDYGKGKTDESTQVDEISADLAKRYYKKATAPGAYKPASDMGHTKDSMRKAHNRVVGSNKAMDRMFRRDKTYKK